MSTCGKNSIEYDIDNKITLQNCFINSDTDVLIILYKIFVSNELKLVFQRLSNSECQKYIKPGNLFVIVDKTNTTSKEHLTKTKTEPCSCANKNGKVHVSDLDIHDGITRWTDKLFWTSSRMLHKKYLVYKQKKLIADSRRLIKKTFSMKIDGRNIRLISYYDEESVTDGTSVSVSHIYKDFFKEKRTADQKIQLEIFRKEIEDINISGYSNSANEKSKELDRMHRAYALTEQMRNEIPKAIILSQGQLQPERVAYMQNGMVQMPSNNSMPMNPYNHPYMGMPMMGMPPNMQMIPGQQIPMHGQPMQMSQNIFYVPQMPVYPPPNYQKPFISPNMHPGYDPNMRPNMYLPNYYQQSENINKIQINNHSAVKTAETLPNSRQGAELKSPPVPNMGMVEPKIAVPITSTKHTDEHTLMTEVCGKSESQETIGSTKSMGPLPVTSKLPSIKDLQLPKL
ncbi:hypothetical protein D499_0T00200 [Hanseniaspora uvarum DSM 2768]|nr:hypothetical protein D499_0T00200 [Hanseniaspora uvarum DSM 2768]GMM43247.1 hypothetical protein DAHU10_041570 [Hanseniaspora uvarum]